MSKICCPMCGSDQVEMIAQPQFQPPPNPTHTNFPKPPMHSLMHYLVNYAAMGATGARGQTSYQCLECEYCFALAFQYEPETTYPMHPTRPLE